MATNTKNFYARATVNIGVNLRQFKAVVEFNKRKLAEIREADPSIMSLSDEYYSRVIKKDEVIKFGDEFIYNEETLQVECYPKEMFDKLSTRKIELAPDYQGLLSEDEFRKSMMQSPVRMSQESMDHAVAFERQKHGFNPVVETFLLVKVEV